MSKVLIFTDLHVHCHKRSADRLQHCLDALEWVFETAIKRGIKDILFLGDLFHDRQKIEVLTYMRTFQVFEKYLCVPGGPPFNVYLLLGNHDLWHLERWDISSVLPLRTLPGVTVIDKPNTISINGTEVSFLPYTHDPAADIATLNNKSKYRILCGHLAVDGAIWNTMHQTRAEVSIEHDGEMSKVDTEVFKGWHQVFLGHYHAEQRLKENVEYVGSPLQLSFGEAFQQKHIIVYDLKTHDKEYIRNDFSPQHFIIPVSDIDKYDLEKNFVRIIVDDIAKSDLVEIRNEVLKNNNVGCLEIKHADKKVDSNLVVDAKAILYQEKEMLEKWIGLEEEQKGLGSLEKTKLLSIGKSIIEKIDLQ